MSFLGENSTSTSSYNEVIAAKDETIATQNTMIKNLENQIVNLNQKLEKNTKALQESIDGVAELTVKYIALNQEYQFLLNQKEK
jgi:uncharacterized protein (DUF3084 family)